MNKIAFPLTPQMKRAEVADLHQALVFLGFSIVDLEKSNQRYGASTRAAVTQFQTAHGLPAIGEVDEATANAFNAVLAERGALDSTPPDLPVPAGRQVSGTVLHADRTPITGLRMRAFHRRVGGEVQLGLEAATNNRGQYVITYQLTPGLSKIDLFVRAYDAKKAIVAVSSILIGARDQEVLDLSVVDARFRGPSEFARATEAVGPQVAGVPLEDLDANDVALLVRNTGVSRESVTAWIASRRLADRTGVDHESLYGLVRNENTASLPRLLRRSATRLLRSLTGAAESNVISHDAGQRAQATVKRLRQLTVELSTSPETPGSLGRLLATCTKAAPAQQAAFIERCAEYEGPVQTLWDALRKDPAFGNAVVDDLQLSLQLGTLAANHPPLVNALRASGVQHASQTATIEDERWHELLQSKVDGQTVGTPANIKGATDDERQDHYITLLKERSARAFPTAHVAKTLKTLPSWQSSTALGFLDINPDFDLLTANIRSSLDGGTAVMKPEWNRATLETELATVQRVARVAPRGQEGAVVNGLLANGYTSALAISRQSRTSFKRRTAQAFGGEATADAVHRNAQFQVARAGTAYALMHPNLGGGITKAVGGISDAVAGDPTWASLFGNVDYCSCEHCRSIYSPAAYLVDLLTWLDGHELSDPNPRRKTAFDRLNEKRPDIQRIELSCENTNTVLPYVDLVNEILEIRVLSRTSTGPNAPKVPQATTGTSPDLLANPEYLNPQAYDQHLAKAVFPCVLPFDLWGELGRTYFEHLGVRRSDLMEALRRQDTPGNDAIDAERLELSIEQWRILTGAAGHSVQEYWGYLTATDAAVFKTGLAIVSNFLHRAGLEYEQLLDLLHSRFANPGGTRITGSACDTGEMTLGPLDDKTLGRMHGFLRLWRNRGWSLLELDKALHALNITTLNAVGLRRLADLDRVQALTRSPLLEMLSWWATIDTFVDRPEKEQPVKCLYDRVYLNRAVDAAAGEPAFPLALNAARTALAHAVDWEDLRSILQAALSIDADELTVLIDETIDGLPNEQRVVTGTRATLGGLSALYRHVSLARRLKVTVSELLGLMRLVGSDPFDLANTDTMVSFVETVADIRASGFSLLEMHYLLEHDAQAETSVGVSDEAIGQTLVELRDGLARVAANYPATVDPATAEPLTTDPVGKATAQYLAVLLDVDAVAAVMTALQTETTTQHGDLEAVLTDNLGAFLGFDAAALIALPVGQRFNAMVALLAPYLQESQDNALIIEKVATFAGLGLDSVQDLLAFRLRMTFGSEETAALAGLRKSAYTVTTASEITQADDAEAFATLRRIYKAAVVLNRLAIEPDTQAWLFEVGVGNGLHDPLSLPILAQTVGPGTWDAWLRLVDVAALGKDLPGGEPTLVELLQFLESPDDPALAQEAFLSALAVRTGWLRADLDKLVGAFAPTFPAGWRDGSILRKLVDAFALIRRLSASASQADRWATAPIGSDQAEELRLAAKSKHDEERWPAVARALRDPVREKQRAALVAYLIARDEGYADEEDLFDDLLIDVEMDPCTLTSRLKQATSSIQLFVQRAFLNLEEGVDLTRDDRDQWEWMKTYRVWEAARKVFLYPENWIEPELRLDKSPLFEQLENTLLQRELDDVAAEKAYTEYLEGLLKVARMEVMGLYHQYEEDEDGRVDVLHVVARTRSSPQEYYYRQWIDARDWTPWEKLDAEIEGNHVILAAHDRRLFLFWPTVAQKAETIPAADPKNDPPTQRDFYEMKLAWIERMNEQWGARKLSTEYLTIDHATWDEQQSSVYFRTSEGTGLKIKCRHNRGSVASSKDLGSFSIDSCTGSAVAEAGGQQVPERVPADSFVDQMRYASSPYVFFTRQTYPSALWISAAAFDSKGQPISDPEDVHVLSQPEDSVASFSYLYPHQYGKFLSQHGVFLDDDERSFHVMPEPVADLDRLLKPDGVDPFNIGTVSGSDVFEPPEKDPPFESELDWEKLQEPPIAAGKGGSRTRATNRLQASTFISEHMSDTLSATALGTSQVQLNEVNQVADGMTFPPITKYRFALFYHPYVCDFMTELRRHGVAGLLDPNPEGSAPRLVRQRKSLPNFFAETYQLTESVLNPDLGQDIDFEIGGAYAEYNWELFFHAPMLIASRLSQNQRFEEARRWFHFMFDPTNRSDDEDPLRFWKIKPFYREPDEPIEEFLALAASAEDSPEAADAREQYDRQIEAWLDDPFSPDAIAALRATAYQKTLVMKYLDNLIAWGDQLFRQDTIETVNEATQLYVLALQLLGDRPQALPPRSVPVPTTFAQVRLVLDASVLNNPLVQLENLTFRPSTRASSVSAVTAAANAWASLLFPKPSIGASSTATTPAFYFCIPPNDKLLSYWDTVEDRLFKIRHCMNIEGVVRQLPLFEPPIDPGMLVRARAAGIDLSSALANLSAPLPHYRFSVMLQRASALNQTVRGLGGALLSALEKKDAEALATLRANQEVALLEAIRQVKKVAIDEAKYSLEAARKSLEVVEQRESYYRGLLGEGWRLGNDPRSMELAQLEQVRLSHVSQDAAHQASKPPSSTWTNLQDLSVTASVGAGPVGGSISKGLVNTVKNTTQIQLKAQSLQSLSASHSALGSISGLTAGHARRVQEWQQQLDAAGKETKQIEQQIQAAAVRVALAEADQASHSLQIENARSVREFMEQKFTNVQLYQWMVGQLSSLYFQSYQLVYDLAKQTERAYRHELALADATFIKFGYWDSLKKGLFAGERLQYDLERMDKAYFENNMREYEITRHVSLALLDPVALLQLQTAGTCEFTVPEALFDVDYPGHYLRRIKSVSVTVPCVVGPYTGVPMRLTLVSSRTRVDPSAAGDYPMDRSSDDPRFQIQTGAVQSMVISVGREDGGLFVSDHRDERYLPFEGSGAISDWSLTMTSAVPTFEWTTMTDVILHLRYTAREGGDLLREAALTSLETELAGLPLRRAFSAKSEFSSEWNAFLRPAEGSPRAVLNVLLAEQLFPHIAQDAGLRITNLELIALVKEPDDWRSTDITVTTASNVQTATMIAASALYDGQPSASVTYASGVAPAAWSVSVPTDQLGTPSEWVDDLILIATYQLELGLN